MEGAQRPVAGIWEDMKILVARNGMNCGIPNVVLNTPERRISGA
jgi:hypothetical protein